MPRYAVTRTVQTTVEAESVNGALKSTMNRGDWVVAEVHVQLEKLGAGPVLPVEAKPTFELGLATQWRVGEDRLKVLTPRAGDLSGTRCSACDLVLGDDERWVVIALGPGRDVESRAAAANGRSINAVAVAVHASCAGVDA